MIVLFSHVRLRVPDKASFGGEKAVDHRVKLGDDDYILGLLPNLGRTTFQLSKQGLTTTHPRMPP